MKGDFYKKFKIFDINVLHEDTQIPTTIYNLFFPSFIVYCHIILSLQSTREKNLKI
jgi:hypothetical protein